MFRKRSDRARKEIIAIYVPDRLRLQEKKERNTGGNSAFAISRTRRLRHAVVDRNC